MARIGRSGIITGTTPDIMLVLAVTTPLVVMVVVAVVTTPLVMVVVGALVTIPLAMVLALVTVHVWGGIGSCRGHSDS